VGVLKMEDEAGGDEKIVAVPLPRIFAAGTPHRRKRARTCRRSPLEQIRHFFEHYKDLEKGKWVKLVRWGGAEDARRLITEGIGRARAEIASRRYSP
jgi:inorganic pyrophosphatase